MKLNSVRGLCRSQRSRRFFANLTLAVVLLPTLFQGRAARAETTPDDLKQWGLETLKQIDTDFALPKGSLYADSWKRGQTKPGGPAFMWGCGVQLPALVAAAKLDPDHYTAPMKRYIDALNVYWLAGFHGVDGYDVLPLPKPPDRYYDDNEWVLLALVDAFELTKEPAYKEKAEKLFAFVLSAEDDKLGGGLYWKEQEKKTKNTCSNGPAIASALRLYQITEKPAYLEAARRLYTWTNAHLQDTDGLYWDNINLDGQVEKMKWSYNTALMLRSNCLFYAVTHEEKYLTEAQRIAKASEAHWVKPETGAFADGGAFAHLLSEAFLYLSEQDHDRHWIDVVRKALTFVHDKVRDSEGRYGEHWDRTVTAPLDKAGLLPEASVARAFLMAARFP